jgi:Kef-type K+ transport system membrane component KefB/nucleotide-binding universal stress UspA family protein
VSLSASPAPKIKILLALALGLLALLAIGAGGTEAAEAGAGAGTNGSSEALLLAQVVVLVVAGRGLGELMQRIGQPSIIGEIVAGMLLGPTVLGQIWPQAQQALFPPSPEQAALLTGISQIGILFLLLLAGMETDLGLAIKLRRKAAVVSASGISVPFACGFGLGLVLPQALLPDPAERLVTALFLGTALSISSLKIVATVVREMNFMRRTIGQLIVASAVIDDTVGWVIIALTFSLATSGSINLMVGLSVVATLMFLALSFTLGRRAVFEIIRWTNDNLRSEVPVVTAIISIMGVMALITHAIGVQTVLGAFVAGILVGESPILTRRIDEQLRGLTTALFMPIFFGLTGLHTDLRVLADPVTLLATVALVVIASLGKFGGAFLGARINNMTLTEALALGFGMNARGSTEVIVASIGLSVGVIDQRLFSMIVAMAVITTLAMPPTLRWALKRIPMRPDEKDRLDREDFEAQSFVGRLERMLIALDDSASARLASLVAGSFAGLRQMPVTVLDVNGEPGQRRRRPRAPNGDGAAEDAPPPESSRAQELAQRIRLFARQAAEAGQTDEDAPAPADLHVGQAGERDSVVDAVAAESEKGHDLFFIGIEPVAGAEHGFSGEIETMIDAFTGATAIVSARGRLRRRAETGLKVLVPVNGDALSTRALEFACVVARAQGARLTALFLHEMPTRRAWSGRRLPRSDETAVFDNIARIAEHYGVEAETASAEASAPAILAAARQGRHNLVIIGVGARADERLSFGPLPDALLETSDRSLVFFMASDVSARTRPPRDERAGAAASN